MSHIGNKIKAGFFATPKRQGEYLTKLIEVKGSGVWLDPTCGEGEILHQLSTPFQSEDCSISTYGVELDKAREEKASSLLSHTVNSPIESMVIQNDSVSLLFLNPPYDTTMKGMDDDHAERKEWTELYRNTRYLKDGGLMIYIIPSYRFADKKIARFLSSNFVNIGLLRFSDEDYDDFRQCIFIGNKKGGKHRPLNQTLFDTLQQMDKEEFILSKITPIDKMIGHHTWEIPAGVTQLKTFYSRLAHKSEFVEGIRNSKGFKAFVERSKPRYLEITGNPILPLNQGQLALILASGGINGAIGEGDNYHLVQGLELVDKATEEEVRNHDNGSKTTITKTRTVRSVSIKAILPSGTIRKMV